MTVKSVSLINPSGRVVRVLETKVPYLLSQGFRPADDESKAMKPPKQDAGEISLDDLRAMAEEMGLYDGENGLHRSTGAAKLKAAIEAAMAKADED